MQHEPLPNRNRWLPLSALLLAGLLALPTLGAAQSHDFTIGVMGGFGGASDADPDTGIDDTGFQLLFSYKREIDLLFSARLGQLDLEADGAGDLFDSELTYLTLNGEYLASSDHYQSGLFLGLGLYRIEGDVFVPDEESFGLNIGASGDFRLTDHFSLLVEVSAHYADLDLARFFVMGHVGVGFHF